MSTAWRTLFRSEDQAWRTPAWLFDELDSVCDFELDASAHPDNALCTEYLTEEDDALARDSWPGERIWLNPPYGRQVGLFVSKAWEQSELYGKRVAVLIFARTDTAWWQDFAMRARAIFLIRGRLRFHKADGERHAAPAPSALLIFGPSTGEPTQFYAFDRRNPEEWKKSLRQHFRG